MSSNVLVQNQQEWTPEQLKLITDVVARGATQDELKLFLYRCKNMGLDPLKPGQIHFVKYGTGPGTIVVGIEGFRSIAARTGKLAGVKRGVLRDDKGRAIAGWAEVYRSDWQYCAREEVPLNEYNTGRGPWQKMPETMIKKVAEAAALRMAFPDDLGGVYERAELDQAEAYSQRVAPEQPGPEDCPFTVETGYHIDFGKWNRKTLEQVYRNEGPRVIAEYIEFLESTAKKKSIEISGKAAVFIKEAETFLGVMEQAEFAPSEEKEALDAAASG